MELKNKKALVTGAASGIGKAIALSMAHEGAEVFLADLNQKDLESVHAQIESIGGKSRTRLVDVADQKQVEGMINAAIGEMGHLDILVNNAGVTLIGEARDYNLEDWEWIMGVNLWSQIYSIHYVLPHMFERKAGHIINMASAAGLVGLPGNAAYSATKFGIVGMSEVLRAELKPHGIIITVVCPGGVQTSFEKNARVRGLPHYQPGSFVKSHERSPDLIADRIIGAIQKEKFLVIIGAEAKLLYQIKRTSIWLYLKVAQILAGNLTKLKQARQEGQ